MAISSGQFVTITDNIAQAITDLEATHITGVASADTTTNTGINGASNSLYAHFAALSDGDRIGLLGRTWQVVSSKVSTLTTIAKTDIYRVFQEYIEALDYDMGGTSYFIEANSLIVPTEFALAHNWVAVNGRTLGVHTTPMVQIPPAYISIPAEQILASIVETAATTNTFTAGTALDTTKYAFPLQMFIKNTDTGTTTGTATVFTITYKRFVGDSNQTANVTLGGTLAAGAKVTVGGGKLAISVSAITQTSGAASDKIAVVVEPDHSIAY